MGTRRSAHGHFDARHPALGARGGALPIRHREPASEAPATGVICAVFRRVAEDERKERATAQFDEKQRNGDRDDERAERYRVAAEDALQQLDWTIGYLHGIRKTDISKALARNRSYIRRCLMRMPDVRVPTDTTEEA